MSSDVFGAVVPKTDSPFWVNDVDSHRQVFNQMAEQLRIIEEVGDHERRRRLLYSSARKSGNFRPGVVRWAGIYPGDRRMVGVGEKCQNVQLEATCCGLKQQKHSNTCKAKVNVF